MNFTELAKKRCSVRAYADKPIAPDAPPPHPVRLLAITPSAATAAAIFVIFFIIDTPFPDTMVSLRRFVVNRVSLFLSLFQ